MPLFASMQIEDWGFYGVKILFDRLSSAAKSVLLIIHPSFAEKKIDEKIGIVMRNESCCDALHVLFLGSFHFWWSRIHFFLKDDVQNFVFT